MERFQLDYGSSLVVKIPFQNVFFESIDLRIGQLQVACALFEDLTGVALSKDFGPFWIVLRRSEREQSSPGSKCPPNPSAREMIP